MKLVIFKLVLYATERAETVSEAYQRLMRFEPRASLFRVHQIIDVDDD